MSDCYLRETYIICHTYNFKQNRLFKYNGSRTAAKGGGAKSERRTRDVCMPKNEGKPK